MPDDEYMTEEEMKHVLGDLWNPKLLVAVSQSGRIWHRTKEGWRLLGGVLEPRSPTGRVKARLR